MTDAELLHQALGGAVIAILGYVVIERFSGGRGR